MTTTRALVALWFARAAEADWAHDLNTANAYRVCARDLEAAPLAGRAPEVAELLARIRSQEAANSGGWPGGDTVDILISWFTGHGYDIDAALADDEGESAGCTCCQTRTWAGRNPDDECPECGHLFKRHDHSREG